MQVEWSFLKIYEQLFSHVLFMSFNLFILAHAQAYDKVLVISGRHET